MLRADRTQECGHKACQGAGCPQSSVLSHLKSGCSLKNHRVESALSEEAFSSRKGKNALRTTNLIASKRNVDFVYISSNDESFSLLESLEGGAS